jgi:hypothetical protein
MSRTLASTLVLVVCIGAASAQPLQQGQAWTDEQIERLVFRLYSNASGARQVFESLMATKIVNIDDACSLTDEQRKKLELAGRGDIERFFHRYEQLMRKSKAIEHNVQGLREILEDVRPLQVTLEVGLFREHSLLVKSLRNTLTDEQIARYEASSPTSADAFSGKWVNVDDRTSGLTRIEIAKKDVGWTIQAWGAAGGGEIDQGKVKLSMLGDWAGARDMTYGFASWDHKFKDSHLTLRVQKDKLIVEDFNIFKDNSGRSNYRKRSEFKKVKRWPNLQWGFRGNRRQAIY